MATPVRNFRCPDHVWVRFKGVCRDEGKDMSEVLLVLIRDYSNKGGVRADVEGDVQVECEG